MGRRRRVAIAGAKSRRERARLKLAPADIPPWRVVGPMRPLRPFTHAALFPAADLLLAAPGCVSMSPGAAGDRDAQPAPGRPAPRSERDGTGPRADWGVPSPRA